MAAGRIRTGRPRVLLTNAIHPDATATLAARADLVTAPDTDGDTLRRLAPDADGIVVRAQLPEDILDHAPHVRGIVRHGVGIDFIPVEAATRRGVMVANLPGSNTNAVAEYVFAALFHFHRPLAAIDTALRQDGWWSARSSTDPCAEIAPSVLGILGLGRVGRRIAEIGRAFGMQVLGTPHRPGTAGDGIAEVQLAELFARSDAVAICCALTPETRGLVDRRLMARMKPGAILINIARGPVVETAALAEAAAAGHIRAALDVHDLHPLPPDSPVLNSRNLLLTPHVASLTATSLRAMSVGAAAEMLRILDGELPLNLVNPGCLENRP